ncbi:MAG: hypothetical protein PHQ05_13535 [Sterolibacterium sp.]|nr:hypothetical protein [Sterolibacterium sp.]
MKFRKQAAESGFFGKLLALVTGTILLGLGLLFSMVALTFIAIVALAVFAYFWWKTRKLRQAMREHPSYGHVIDGEAIVVDEFKEEKPEGLSTLPPRNPPPG